VATQPSLGGGVSGTGHFRLRPPNSLAYLVKSHGLGQLPIGNNLESQGENTCNEAEKHLMTRKGDGAVSLAGPKEESRTARLS
jgi:hypothetical protein